MFRPSFVVPSVPGRPARRGSARSRSGRFFNFNGTAGIWRREAIYAGGGWQHDTLTEDLDLSYRAQLRGWKFVFLRELAAPAELPAMVPPRCNNCCKADSSSVFCHAEYSRDC